MWLPRLLVTGPRADQTGGVATSTPAPDAPAVERSGAELREWLALAEELIVERAAAIDFWEAARWAAGHERLNPPLSTRALQAWVVQTATNTDKLDGLEAAHRRIKRAVSARLWTGADRGPVAAIDEESVEEVRTAVLESARTAFTAVVLTDELRSGVIPTRRREQLVGAIERIAPELAPDTDSP